MKKPMRANTVAAVCKKHKTMKAAAEELGITDRQLRNYKQKYPSVAKAILQGRKVKGDPRGRKKKFGSAEDKQRLIESVFKHRAVITPIAEELGVVYQTIKNYYENDEEVQQAVVDANAGILDLAEQGLYRKLEAEDLRAITYVLDRKGKDRGYTTRVENIITEKPAKGYVGVSPDDWDDEYEQETEN